MFCCSFICSVLCGLIGFMLIAGTIYDSIRRLQQKEKDKPGNKLVVKEAKHVGLKGIYGAFSSHFMLYELNYRC